MLNGRSTDPPRAETPEALERAAVELVRLANENTRDLGVAGDLVDLAEQYMRRADELRVLMGQPPRRPPHPAGGGR